MEGRQKDQRKKVRNTENKQNPGGPSQVHVSHFLFLEKNKKTKQNKSFSPLDLSWVPKGRFKIYCSGKWGDAETVHLLEFLCKN